MTGVRRPTDQHPCLTYRDYLSSSRLGEWQRRQDGPTYSLDESHTHWHWQSTDTATASWPGGVQECEEDLKESCVGILSVRPRVHLGSETTAHRAFRGVECLQNYRVC
jgi:hypothetical protein